MTAIPARVTFLKNDLNKLKSSAAFEVVKGMSFTFEQFERPGHWEFEDNAEFRYVNEKLKKEIELMYWLIEPSSNQKSDFTKPQVVDSIKIRFDSSYLKQFIIQSNATFQGNQFLDFNYPENLHQSIQLCFKTSQCLNQLRELSFNSQQERILVHAQSQMLLLYAIEDCMPNETDNHIVCKFLTNDIDQAKIFQAKEILLQHLANPITIKDLSKKVAMNECYLKKGFKEIVGSTIFEFYQHERMAHARNLLCERGLNVTEVADLMGYSSISHFSTAFKKHTGMKPCELLLR